MILFNALNSFSQESNTSMITADALNKFDQNKSANFKDILTNLFQITTTNLSGNDKSIEFNTNLFALKSKANPELLKDVNFEKEMFSRKFQFNAKVNLDDQFKYKGFTGGATFAIIDGRNKQLVTFSNNYLKPYKLLLETIAEIRDSITNDDSYDVDKLENAINAIYSRKELTGNSYFDTIKSQFKQKAKKKSLIDDDPIAYVDSLKKIETAEYANIDAKPLWTISVDGTAGDKGKFNKASFQTIFLQGIKDKSELDCRAKLIYADTVTINPMPRMEFIGKVGFNFKIAKGTNNVSFFEIKGSFEYNSILRNVLPDEKKDKFLGTSEIRLRLTNDLWFPLIIKYDIEKHNFLGFLNVTYNFGSYKSKT